MKTKTILTIFALSLFLLASFAAFSSAAYYGGVHDPYYGRGNYDSSSYYSQRTNGDFDGYRQTTTNQYNRVSESYWDGNEWVDRTTYTRETRDSPSYYANGYSGQRYSNYYNRYPSYNSRYYDYRPSYYGDYGYNYAPTNYYGGYSPSYRYGYY